MAAQGWYKGIVKSVSSGDTLVIMGFLREIEKDRTPPEKTITLSSISAPRPATKNREVDEPFAWDSREFLRKKSIGKEVTFKVDYTNPTLKKDFGSVFLGETNLSVSVVANGWAKVRQGGKDTNERSPNFADLCKAEEQAQGQGVGIWNKAPGASSASIRDIPAPSTDDSTDFNAEQYVELNKGKDVKALVDYVRDGSFFKVILPDNRLVQVRLAGVQAPSMGSQRRPQPENGANGDPETAAQKLASVAGSPAEEWAVNAKHFAETRVLHRDVILSLVDVDKKYNLLVGRVVYMNGDDQVDLAAELLKEGLAKYVPSNNLRDDDRRKLKDAELQAKKEKLRCFANFVAPPTNPQAIQNFTGLVIEVVSGDCIMVEDSTVTPPVERRINLSSIIAPKLNKGPPNATSAIQPEPFAREAREFLRSRLIKQEVRVVMDYSRKLPERTVDCASVFLPPARKSDAPQGINVAQLVVEQGYASVVKHKDDNRSSCYESLLKAEREAITGKRGKHGPVQASNFHVKDLTLSTSQLKDTQRYLPFLQKAGRLSAHVEFVLSGHRFKLFVKKETCTIWFSLSGVRAPKKDEPFSIEAIALMRKRTLQMEVEIEVETVDRSGTFLGTMWESKANVGALLLEAGLGKMQSGFADRVTEGHLLLQAQENARKQRLKLWGLEGAETPEVSVVATSTTKEPIEVEVTEVLDGTMFYVQPVKDHGKLENIQKQLQTSADRPVMGFEPKKGTLVAAHFAPENAWFRAMIVNVPRAGGEYEIFYIDYGNKDSVPLNKLRPLDVSLGGPGIALLCSFAYIKVPNLNEDFGEEAAEFVAETVANMGHRGKARIEDTDYSGGKVRGQGTGTRYLVTLMGKDSELSVNAAMLENGLARLEKASKRDNPEKQAALGKLKDFQDKARVARSNIWRYGDVESDDEDQMSSKRGGRR